jgi:hypothetical protein
VSPDYSRRRGPREPLRAEGLRRVLLNWTNR